MNGISQTRTHWSKYVLILLGALFILYFMNDFTETKKSVSDLPKKILIFTIHGGGGHQSVCKTLQSALSKKYNVEYVDVMPLVASLDPIHSLSFKKFSGTTFYNFLLKKNWIRSANILGKIGQFLAVNNKDKMEKVLAPYVEKHTPACIISVIPFFNAPLYSIAEKKDIPFLIVTNDLDTTNYAIGLKEPKFSKFRYTLSFEHPAIRQKITGSKIPENHVRVTGFPLRADFYEKKLKDKIAEHFNLPTNRPIILLMMGAAGSQALYDYVDQLVKIETPVHVVVCLGRNARLRQKLESLTALATHASFTLLDFTDRISDLMAVSHLMITKPGPNSICEALQMNIPVLLDLTNPTLYWEDLNVKFVKSNEVGDVIRTKHDINSVINKYLLNPQMYKKMRQNIASLPKPDFNGKIDALINEVLSSEVSTTQKALSSH